MTGPRVHCVVDVFEADGRFVVRSPQLPGWSARVDVVDKPALERQMKSFHSRHMSFSWFAAPVAPLEGMGYEPDRCVA